MRAFLLKSGATLLTIATTAASAFYVAAHVKNPSAPLQPAVLPAKSTSLSTLGGQLTIGPAVRSSDVQPVASTHAS